MNNNHIHYCFKKTDMDKVPKRKNAIAQSLNYSILFIQIHEEILKFDLYLNDELWTCKIKLETNHTFTCCTLRS